MHLQWNQVDPVQREHPLIYEGYAGAFASFFETSDPNAHKLTNSSQPGVQELKSTDEEFVIDADGFSKVKVTKLEKRCSFWRDIAAEVPI